MTEPARYRVIGPRTDAKIGTELIYAGVPGVSLLPLNQAAQTAKAAAIEPHQYASNPIPLAKSVGFLGRNAHAARQFIRNFVAQENQREDESFTRARIVNRSARETARQSATPISTKGP